MKIIMWSISTLIVIMCWIPYFVICIHLTFTWDVYVAGSILCAFLWIPIQNIERKFRNWFESKLKE